jgi:hypothetical protein
LGNRLIRIAALIGALTTIGGAVRFTYLKFKPPPPEPAAKLRANISDVRVACYGHRVQIDFVARIDGYATKSLALRARFFDGETGGELRALFPPQLGGWDAAEKIGEDFRPDAQSVTVPRHVTVDLPEGSVCRSCFVRLIITSDQRELTYADTAKFEVPGRIPAS